MNAAIERNAFLESELDEKEQLKSAVQRYVSSMVAFVPKQGYIMLHAMVLLVMLLEFKKKTIYRE